MPSVVTLKVVVDDGNSKQTIDALDGSLQNLGQQGSVSVRKLGQNIDQLGGHSTTALDNIRLLSQEFGFRMPRAMEAALSRMPALTAAMGEFSGALLGVAAAEVFVRMGTELYHLEQNFLSIQAPIDKFYETLRKTSELDFTNTHSLATTNFRMGQAEQNYANAPQAAQSMQRAGLLGLVRDMGNPAAIGGDIASLMGAHQMAQTGATAASQTVELTRRQIDQTHELALARIELAHANDALNKTSQPMAEFQKQEAINAENRSYQNKLDKFYGNPVPEDAGSTEETQKNAEARAKMTEQETEMYRRESAERIQAQNEAVNSGLEGEALYRAQLEESIAAITRKFQDGEITKRTAMAETAAASEKYQNEEGARIQKQLDEAQKMLEQSRAAGLTGASRVVAEHDARVNQINSDRTLDPQAAAIEREAAYNDMVGKLKELDDEFTQHTQESIDERTGAMLGGFAKIDAAAQGEHDKLKKLYDNTFNAEHPATAEQQGQYQAASDAIDANATQQKRELQEKNAADDLASSREAAQAEARVREQGVNGWLASYKDAIAEINLLEQQRLAKLQEDAQKEGLTWEEVAQRQEDIQREAAAQIAQQNQELQHTLEGQLQQAFTNPVQYIKQQMQKMFFEILADWIMRLTAFKGTFGQTMGSLGPGGASASGSTASSGIGLLSTAARNAFGIGHGISTGAPAGTRGFISGGTSSTAASVSGGYGFPSSSAGGYTSGTWSSPEVTFGGTASADSGFGIDARSATGTVAPAARSGAAPSYSNSGIAGIGGDITSVSHDASSLLRTLGVGGKAATGIGAGTSSSDDFSGFGENGEDGGFAGYMTGDTSDMAASDAAAGIGGDIGATASSQATAMQSVGGAPSAAGALSGVMGVAGAVGGAYAGTEGVLDSFHQGGVNGALKGAMSGMEAGAAIGSIIPGLGTAVGALIGLGAGLDTALLGDALGENGKFAARDYYKKTLFPQLEDIENQFNSGGGGDYLSAISQANSIEGGAMNYMSQKWGADAATWVKDNYLDKEVAKVTGDIMRRAAGGGAYTGRTAAEFHTGGTITDFHDFATSGNEGFIHAMLGEGIVNTDAMSAHAPYVAAMNSGADASQMAAMYLQSSGARSGGSSVTNYHTHQYNALDAKSFKQFLDSGGMKTINEAQNRRVSLYAGDAIG